MELVKPVECIEKLDKILALIYEIEGALIYHCFADSDVCLDEVTEEQKQSWPSLRKTKQARDMLKDMIHDQVSKSDNEPE
ncbi:MAG TPA: hypothetical protein DD791_10855 [Syntrophomonas sp.]|jgi:hypothetical protein|nr:hypothetical protein [Syntrophomonas sp.]